MLRFAAIAVVAALSALGAAQAVTLMGHNRHQQQQAPELRRAESVTPIEAAATPTPDGTAAAVVKAADGHYWAEALVDGKRVRFLIDTGATTVALTTADAMRLGFDPKTLDFNYKVATANGKARAAGVKLASVSVAGARVQDVDAMVIENGGLSSSLLGMTYLGRLSRFEATPTALILRP